MRVIGSIASQMKSTRPRSVTRVGIDRDSYGVADFDLADSVLENRSVDPDIGKRR